MYPARWFPVNDYTTDRYNADMRITVPTGFTVLGERRSRSSTAPATKSPTRSSYDKPSFPGSIAVVQGATREGQSEGVTSTYLLPHQAEHGQRLRRGSREDHVVPDQRVRARAAGQSYVCRDRERNAERLFRARHDFPFARAESATRLASRLLANQISRQWWGTLVSPANRNHMWLQNGNARYAEMLYLEHANGPGALEQADARHVRGSSDRGQSAADSIGAAGGLFARILGRRPPAKARRC